jgi:hypothetical protein
VETPVVTFASSARFDEEIEAKKVTGSDRTLALGAPARPISSGRGTREGLQRADTGRVSHPFLRTKIGCIKDSCAPQETVAHIS